MQRFGIFGIWLLVVIGATTVTWQIVSAADDQVSDRPIAPLNVAAPVLTDATSTTLATSDSTTTSSTPAATAGDGTTPTSSGTTSPQSTTTSSLPAPTSATVAWQSRTIPTPGGTVVVRYRPGEVEYQSATPAPGFQVEVEKAGPPDVKVEFESQTQKFEVEAKWEDNGLDVKTSASSED